MKAKDIMVRDVITVHQNDSIESVARILVSHNISGVPVVNDAGNLVGMVTEGDLLYKEVNPRLPDYVNVLGAIIFYNGVEQFHDDFKKLIAGRAREIMSDEVITVSEDTELQEVAQIMVENGIKRVPVVKDQKMIGIISRCDMIKTLIS